MNCFRCGRPTMKASIWANHGSNIFGVPDNLHLTELIAILRDPCPQRIPSLSAILNPTAFALIQIEASNGIHRTKCWCQCSHQLSKKRMMQQRDRQRKRIVHAGCKNARLSGFLGILVSWSHRKIGAKGHCQKETTRRTTLSYSSGHQELLSL